MGEILMTILTAEFQGCLRAYQVLVFFSQGTELISSELSCSSLPF